MTAPVSDFQFGTSSEKTRPQIYPAATPMNVKILKIDVGNLGMLKKRREYPTNPTKMLNAKRGPQTLKLVLIVEILDFMMVNVLERRLTNKMMSVYIFGREY